VKGTFVNGTFTMGENIADLGGVNIAFDALEMYLKDKGKIGKIDGYTQEQRFF
jgi:putative endopeptidase